MNSAPCLLTEDRPDFERVLDEALRAAEQRNPGLSTTGQRLSTHQLRTMALSAATAISACAATEYDRYVQARDSLRTPAPPGPAGGERGHPTRRRGLPGRARGGCPRRVRRGPRGRARRAGTGARRRCRGDLPDRRLRPADVRAGRGRRPAPGHRPAQRRRPARPGPGRGGGPGARDVAAGPVGAGHGAVPQRGDGERRGTDGPRPRRRRRGPGALRRPPRANAPSRTPHLGYSHPGFTSPGDGGSDLAPGPRYSSPDFTSPEFGGRDHRPS